jgi:hypothetical protein
MSAASAPLLSIASAPNPADQSQGERRYPFRSFQNVVVGHDAGFGKWQSLFCGVALAAFQARAIELYSGNLWSVRIAK